MGVPPPPGTGSHKHERKLTLHAKTSLKTPGNALAEWFGAVNGSVKIMGVVLLTYLIKGLNPLDERVTHNPIRLTIKLYIIRRLTLSQYYSSVNF